MPKKRSKTQLLSDIPLKDLAENQMRELIPTLKASATRNLNRYKKAMQTITEKNTQLMAFQQSAREREAEVAELVRQRDKLQSACEEKQDEIDSLQADVEKKDKHINRLQLVIGKATAKAFRNWETLTRARKRIKNYKKAIRALAKEI